MRGGLVFFRGAGAEARAYLEADHSHADEYYLEGGGAVAGWTALNGAGMPLDASILDGVAYQAWVDWRDPQTGGERGAPRAEVRVRENGELRVAPASPKFVEMTVNADKSLSVAAALDPRVSAALDQAEASAVEAMNTYMATNSVTRVGARGAQRFVPVERLESVAVVHRTSRAGDPHRHVHLQWSTRVFAEGKWRALHTAATLKQQGALRGVGEAALTSHQGLRDALAAAGFDYDAGTGKVRNLAAQSRVLAKRARQVETNVARLEAEWKSAHPGHTPDKATRREWDQQAWALDRPRKRDGNVGSEKQWIEELREAGLQVDGFAPHVGARLQTLLDLDVSELVREALTSAEGRASAWSIADLEGYVGVAVAARDVAADAGEVAAYTRRVARQVAATLPTLEVEIAGDLPAWVRNLTSERVLQVEADLRATFLQRGLESGLPVNDTPIGTLNAEQSDAAHALASAAPLVVIEGAAGAGKTTMLGAATDLMQSAGGRLVVVAPTLRAAAEAGAAIGADASSAHKLVHEYGFRWDERGAWWRLQRGEVDRGTGLTYQGPSVRLTVNGSTRIVVDEAGMLDQDLAHALMVIADETGARVALVGDRAQLPAVGRGGVMDLAVAAHPRPLDMKEVHRFADPEYAAISLRLRDREAPGQLFADLLERGHIQVHASEDAAREAIAADIIPRAEAGARVAVAVSSNDAAAQLNATVQDAHMRSGHTRTPGVETAGSDGLSIRVGDRVMTRKNNTELGVRNRDSWTASKVHSDGSVTVVDGARTAHLPAEYVAEHTHLAYASTVYGVQGATVDYGHGVVTDATSAQGLYVAATRGRHGNTLHVIAGDVDEARAVFTDALRRESGDRGVEAARAAIYRDVDGAVLPQDPPFDEAVRDERHAMERRAFAAKVREWESARESWSTRHPGIDIDEYPNVLADLAAQAAGAEQIVAAAEDDARTTAVSTRTGEWEADYAAVQAAQVAVDRAPSLRRRGALQKHADQVAAFRRRHQAAPALPIPAREVEAWRAAATSPGASAELDRLRKGAGDLRREAEQLQKNPPPRSARPQPPTAGTPAEEAQKDDAYRRRRDARRAQQQRDTQLRSEPGFGVDRGPGLQR